MAVPPYSLKVGQLKFPFEALWREDEPVLSPLPPGASPFHEHASTASEFHLVSIELSEVLRLRLGRPVRVSFTDNRRTMLSSKEDGARLLVRLHHMFAEANVTVIDALVDYLRGTKPKSSTATLDTFIADNLHRIDKEKRRAPIITAGAHYNLSELLKDIGSIYFPDVEPVRITWGRRVVPKKDQRSLQLGTYLPDEKLIRIHPILDQEWVPRYFVEAVVYHELKAEVIGGKQHFHTKEFRRRERLFEHHQAANRWEKSNLSRLLRPQ